MGFTNIYTAFQAMERGNWPANLTTKAITSWIREGYLSGGTPPTPTTISKIIVEKSNGVQIAYRPAAPPVSSENIKKINVVFTNGTVKSFVGN
jgi:hypothetical protein